jgi:predicted amidophosphoribosyltransferase
MSDGPPNFEEFRRRREENASTVRCAKCGEWIVATVTRCPECGVHFQGEAQDFADAAEPAEDRSGAPAWVVVLAVLLLLAILVAGLQ